jgi:periplasmic copper chaperone A
MRVFIGLAAILIGSTLFATSSFAHVTLAVKEAAVGADYKATFQVPHGCKGSATVELSVEIPSGLLAVKPQPKPGWKIEILTGAYDKPYHHYRSEVSDGVKSVTWSGGDLPDDYYDEFVLVGYLDNGLQPGSWLYFPTVQTCKQGTDRWTDIPDDSKSADEHRSPAPSLKLLPPAVNSN